MVCLLDFMWLLIMRLKEIDKPWDRNQLCKCLFIMSLVPGSETKCIEHSKKHVRAYGEEGRKRWVRIFSEKTDYCTISKLLNARTLKKGRDFVCLGDLFGQVFGVWKGKIFPNPWVLRYGIQIFLSWQCCIVEGFRARKPWFHQSFGKINLSVALVSSVDVGWGSRSLEENFSFSCSWL